MAIPFNKVSLPAILLVCIFSTQSHAQIIPDTGPPVDSLFNPFPETGAWFANDGSSTGFFLEFVNRQVGGAYFGSDSEGNNVWLTFSGLLDPLNVENGPDFEPGWVLTTNLNQVSNTGCILNCSPNLPSSDPVSSSVGEISFIFSGRNAATFSIDGSELVNIIPLLFGVSATSNNPAEPLEFLPNMQGTWVIAEGLPIEVGDSFLRSSATNFGEASSIIDIGFQETIPLNTGDAFLQVSAPITRSTNPLFSGADINCIFSALGQDPENSSPDCNITGPNITTGGINLPFAFISDVRFVGWMPVSVGNEQIRFEGFRLGAD